MELSLEEQTQAFIYSCVLGACLAAVYTLMGIIKIISPPGKRLLFVTDVCFMLACALAAFLYSVAMTQGSLRYYVVLGELLGFFLFYLFIGELILKCAESLAALTAKAYFFITKPFRSLFRRLCRLIAGFWSKMRNKIKLCKKIKKKKPKSSGRKAPHEAPKRPRITAKPKERID